MNKYPVVFACDENYAMPFAVTVESLLGSADKNTFYDVYCLVPELFSEETMERLKKIQEKYQNCNITYLNLSGEFEEVKMNIAHISFVTYYRFKIAELLPQYDKALYLDVDMIINKDLTDLFETDLKDCYVGAVKHPTLLHRTKIQDMEVPENSYFNAGQLLMNLDLIRKDNKDKEFINMMPKQLPIQDQDILNIVCGKKVKHLPLKYNMMTRLCSPFERLNAKKIYKKTYDEALKNPSIIHYADRTKPWDYSNVPFNDLWDKVFVNSCYGDTIELSNRKKVNKTKVLVNDSKIAVKKFLIQFDTVKKLNNLRKR